MYITYSDDVKISEQKIKSGLKKLTNYRQEIFSHKNTNRKDVPEYSLYYPQDFDFQQTLDQLKKEFKGIKHLILIGIGGSNLGTEAIHSVLDTGKVELSVLDTISAHHLQLILNKTKKLKKVSQIAICIISKSGQTTETLANSSVLLEDLNKHFGESLNKQLIFIGNPKTELEKYAKKISATYITMPEIIGGRYSVATAVGLVPLALLGHDTDEFISGYLEAFNPQYEEISAVDASRIALYYQNKYHHYNFFAFEPRLEKLGRWYRQLFAESLGKEFALDGKKITHALVPDISTPVELHSTGQLYMSGVPKTYTDFVTFDDDTIDYKIPNKNKLVTNLKNYTLQEIVTGLYSGVVTAYKERNLPYRATIFDENLAYSLGLFMAMRLREVMYTAKLLNLNAFDQPNVELYKTKTKEILKI